MKPKDYQITQRETYEKSGVSQVGLERKLEPDGSMWSIEPESVMPSRTRVLTGILQVHDGSNTRMSLGSMRIS